MTKFSRPMLSAALLAGFAVLATAGAPAVASVPSQHRAPAKAHTARGPVRHIAATGTDAAVRTPSVSSTPVAAPAAVPAVTPVAPLAAAPAPAAASTAAPLPTGSAATAKATAPVSKPVVKTN